MISYRRKRVVIFSLLVAAILLMSVGFAVFSTTLTIKPSLSVNPDVSNFSVKFSSSSNTLTETNVSPSQNDAGLETTDAKITNQGTPTISNFSAIFTEAGQSVTYTFYVRNEGKYNAYLKRIVFSGKTCTAIKGTTQSLVDEACNYIEINVKIGNVEAYDSMDISSTDVSALGPTKSMPVEVTVSYYDEAAIDGDFSVEFGSMTLEYSSQ